MSKLDNRIYLTICEVSLERFKKSKFITFMNYCKDLGMSLNDGTLSGKQKADLIEVIEMLDKIYSMDEVTTAKYLSDFYNSDNIRQFEKAVLLGQQASDFSITF